MEDNTEHALVNTLYDFSRRQKYTDFVITVGNSKAFVHKPVICADNAYLDSVCSGGANEVTLDGFGSPQEDEEVLTKVIRFIYLSSIDLNTDIVLRVLQAAEFIKNQYLKKACENFLIPLLSVPNWQVYAEKAQQFGLTALTEACNQLCRSSFSQLITIESFLPNLSVTELVSYIEDDDLAVSSEDDILHSVHVWITKCKANEEKKEEYLEQLFPHIRLSFCNNLKSFIKEKNVSEILKLKVSEYLFDDVKRAFTPRSCYAGARVKAPTATSVTTKASKVTLVTTKASEATSVTTKAPTATSVTTKAPEATSVTTKVPKATSVTTNPILMLPTALQRSTDNTESQIVIVGGRLKQNKTTDSVIFLDQQKTWAITQAWFGAGSKKDKAMKIETKIKYKELAKAKLCENSCFYSVCVHKERIITSGGYVKQTTKTGKSVSSVRQYSMKTQQWHELPDLLNPRCKHASTCVDEHLYILAGCYRENCEDKQYYTEVNILDLKTLHWTKVQGIPLIVDSPGIAVVNRQIIVTGGWSPEQGYSKQTLKYNINIDQWIRCKDIPENNAYPLTSMVSISQKIYVLAHQDLHVYDVLKDKWCKLCSPPIPSFWNAMILWNDSLLAIGGFENNNKDPHDRLQRYDLHTQKWSLLEETLPFPMSYLFAFVMQPPKPL